MASDLYDLVEAQHQDMLLVLQQLKDIGGTQKTPDLYADIDLLYDRDIGVRVKVTPHGWIVLTRQLLNWRLLDCRTHPVTGKPDAFSGWHRAWCYNGPNMFMTSLLAAVAWSGEPDTEPSGWIKSLPDQRRNGEPHPGITQE